MDFSLMFPTGSKRKTVKLSDECINDLSLDYIVEMLTDNKQERDQLRGVMTSITGDAEVIRYRCDVFEDFLRLPQLREAMSELVLRLKDLQDIERFQNDTDMSSLWSLMNRLREVDDYIECITLIKDRLAKMDLNSAGMRELRDIVTNIPLESGFAELKADINEMMTKAQSLKSITIGVNLDSFLRPEAAGVVALNDTKFKDAGIMGRFMDFSESKKELHEGADLGQGGRFHAANPSTASRAAAVSAAINNRNVETSNVTGKDPLSNALRRQVTEIMRRTVSDIKSTIKKYVDFSGYSLIKLMPEILFFVRWAELVERLIRTGLPLCKAEILPCEQREIHLRDTYNLKLLLHKLKGEDIDIIRNDIDFDDRYRIFILTGPNRGGKTIFTQAVGLVVLMAQWGIYVPAKEAQLSPCDNVFTHFPADENDTVDLGRLGEESKRLSEIFDKATDQSLMLLNESLATTSVAEGLFIATDVVKAMRYLGCRAIFNTHMHALAQNLEVFNEQSEGDSRVESLVTGMHHGRRSFKVAIIPPQGTSYAKDIAVRYGVTFDTIKASIDNKR